MITIEKLFENVSYTSSADISKIKIKGIATDSRQVKDGDLFVCIKGKDDDGHKHYDFQFTNSRGYKTTIEGLSHKFDKEYWNYAKLISGVLRYGMPIGQVIKLVSGLQLDSESINTWKAGVERALKKYMTDTDVKEMECPECHQHSIVVKEGCFVCSNCGYSKCGG